MIDAMMITSPNRRAGAWLARPHRLRVLLVERELRHADAAALVGISTGVFARVACASTAAWPALRARMCDVFDIDEDELFEHVG
jgi:hypothetical protein